MYLIPRVVLAQVHLLVLAFLVTGCSMVTFGAVNPVPQREVPDTARSYSLEVSPRVKNDQVLDTIAIRQFHETLENGFHNAAGDRYVASPSVGACRLVIDSATLSTANLGKLGKYLTLKYRARWLDDNGVVIAELVGLAQPRDPTETRPRHLEDVVEVMYEQLIAGLAGVETPGADRVGLRP